MNFNRMRAILISALLSFASLPAATIIVYPTLATGATVRAEIHLFEGESKKDLWPSGRVLSAVDIPPGQYALKVSSPGFRPFERQLEVTTGRTEVRAVLSRSKERDGTALATAGCINAAPVPSRLWVLAFPLHGPPSDTTECRVTPRGEFDLRTLNSGPYLLTVVDGPKVLATMSIYIGTQNPPILIDLAGTSTGPP